MDVAVKVFTTAYTVNKQAKAGAKAANIGTSADDWAGGKKRIRKVHSARIIAALVNRGLLNFKI